MLTSPSPHSSPRSLTSCGVRPRARPPPPREQGMGPRQCPAPPAAPPLASAPPVRPLPLPPPAWTPWGWVGEALGGLWGQLLIPPPPSGLSSSPLLAPSPPQTPGAHQAATPNQRAEGAEGTNGASTPGLTHHAVKRESSPILSPVEQPMGCQLPLPLANGRLDHNLDAPANHFAPLLPAAFHRPIVLLGSGPLPNHVPPRDAGSPPPGAGPGPRLRTPDAVGGGGS